ncbi:hypothetical protein PHLCEN_2v771, partial [Hermanssonia centrifuga]
YREKVRSICLLPLINMNEWLLAQDGYTMEELDVYGVVDGKEAVVVHKTAEIPKLKVLRRQERQPIVHVFPN